MNWLDKMTRPKLSGLFKKRETPDNLWHKCRKCGWGVLREHWLRCPWCRSSIRK